MHVSGTHADKLQTERPQLTTGFKHQACAACHPTALPKFYHITISYYCMKRLLLNDINYF